MVIGRVKRVFNMSLTPFAEGLKETYKWYLRHENRHENRKPDFALEDTLIRQVREPARASG
jgi:dTDP-D-glucose 4,6-dehydratase